ncbi:rhodanese-like domain-containing protein, partial [Lactobacillus sp. XV13L]|nr:rhodanese-like domain-containing protein [Lactobacillus sp. XV13L]
KKMQIQGANPCPAKDIASHLNTFDHDKTYVVYDWNSGTILAKTALMQLLDAGFNAYELAGDFEGWQGMNLPLEKAY